MDDEHTTGQDEARQDEARQDEARQSGQRWTTMRTMGAVAFALGIAAAGGTVVYAAQSSGSGGSGDSGDAVAAGQHGGAGLASALHGEYVVSDGDDGYTTAVTQTGTVTAVGASSVTVASDDGYTRTYTVDAGTVLGSPAAGASAGSGGADTGSAGGDGGSGAGTAGGLADIAEGDTVTIVGADSDGRSGTGSFTAESVTEGGAQAGPDAQTGRQDRSGQYGQGGQATLPRRADAGADTGATAGGS